MNNIKISRNVQVTTLHVANATAWVENIQHRLVRGDTLFFDYIFFVHPTAIGHWCGTMKLQCFGRALRVFTFPGRYVGQQAIRGFRCEILFPLYSVLKDASFKIKSMNMILLHLRRKHLMEWVRNVIATTLHVHPGGSLPAIWLQEDADDSYSQLVAPLQGVPANTWVGHRGAPAQCIETAGVVFVYAVEHQLCHASDKCGHLGVHVQCRTYRVELLLLLCKLHKRF